MSCKLVVRDRRRRDAMRSASGLVLALALAAPAYAADDAEGQVDEIVVTGQREAQRAAIAVKKSEFVVADVVSADDIGKLPDHNTAAALRRIPGVSVMEDQGEPRFPVLRGLRSTYNRTTIDGAVVASVDESGRTVPMDIVPSVMAGRLEVIKTVTPENDGNAIGGVINVTTRSAFDAGRPFFNGMASIGDYERSGGVRNDKRSYRVAFAAGRTFGADDEWGVVIGASQEQLDYDIPQVESQDPSVREYTAAGAPVNSGAATGNGIQVPTFVRLFWYNNTKQRSGVNGKIEYRPTADFHWEASGLFARMEDDEERIEFRTEPLGNVTNQTPTSGTFARGRGVIQLNQPITKREIGLARTSFDWTFAPQWKADGDLIYSQAGLEVPNESVEFRTVDAQGANYAFNYDTTNPLFPLFNPVNPANLRNPANYVLQQHRDALTKTDESTYQARFNLAFDDGGDEHQLKAKVGGALRSTKRDFSSSQVNYTAPAGFVYTLAEVDKTGPTELIAGRYLLSPRIDADLAHDFREANRSRFTITTAAPTGNYDIKEDIYAVYGQASYSFGDVTVLAGARYERTEVDSNAVRNTAGRLTPVSNSGSYGNFLPSVHLQWKLRDDLIVRAAWTNTIGRPDYGSLGGGETLNFDGSQPTLSRGNPNLKARESEGFDLSVEFYPPDGLISLAVFSKDIKNEIFTLSASEQLDVGRGVEAVTVSTPRNAESAKIKGLEFAIQQAFTFLPEPFDGFGFNGNLTVLDTEFAFLTRAGRRVTGLFQQPDLTTNESIYYQRGPFEARVSHNYIGGFLETINDTIPNADQYWKGRHLFDASVSWRFNDHFTVFAEAQNLSNTGRQEVTGPNRRNLQEWANYGRTYWLGVAANF
ncbi:MAG: TonB-dependent receptor [Alphaproteobacteria bacterium]|nr:TonB-dependent receptor [Alphaproteobacteria bacterium]MBU1517092.1 TonB-dependent receptor [Alphaproteobacteria bacterium]MBU2093711.1 TonB-dependent receptor [Alphaproteobacteria bacterium]MBU2153967.1 TonB-dependent receptor [Alphaproteobacteria bacterium]MBU2308689.1 TonB-dependent receptor [Alphaproteobacteria bacterium]